MGKKITYCLFIYPSKSKLFFAKIAKIFILLVALLTITELSYASYQINPEYRSLSANKYLNIVGPEKFDSEYQSDALTYYKPFKWKWEWLKHKNSFDLSAGSVSSKRFNIETQLKVEQNLTERLSFKAIFFDQSNLVETHEAEIIEFQYKLIDKLFFAIYGELDTEKSNDDLGFAVSYQFMPTFTMRTFYTMGDFSRNERNETDDEYPKSPVALGVVVRKWDENKGNFLEFALRSNNSSLRRFPGDKFDYKNFEKYMGFTSRTEVSQYSALITEFSFERRFDEILPQTESEFLAKTVDYKEGTYLFQWEEDIDVWNLQAATIVFGLQHADRSWIVNGSEVKQRSTLPHIWVRKEVINESRVDLFEVGLELTVYDSRGDFAIRSEFDKNYALEQRLNIGYNFNFKESSMRWLLTFDLDRFGTGESWEGGSGQYRMSF